MRHNFFFRSINELHHKCSALEIVTQRHSGPFLVDDSGSAHDFTVWTYQTCLSIQSRSLVVLCVLGSNEEVPERPLVGSTARRGIVISEGGILKI